MHAGKEQRASLPIDARLDEVVARLRDSSRLILRAEPGAGKTTRVPPALLDAGLAGDGRILVLEPRRIAARAAAERVAGERHGRVGGEVGYRVRFEQRGDERTRLWYLTEGVLQRQLLDDPYLEEAKVVVLDEFHERHLPADLALGIVLELQETVRPDLRLLIMSATLDTTALRRALGGTPVLEVAGRTHPVEIEYDPDDGRPLGTRVAAAVDRLLRAGEEGDVLVFLPGAREIRHAARDLTALATRHDLDVVALHGELPLDAQRRAIERGPRRKVVLSTNVAETSLTVEGVSAVVDSGRARIARFDARHGINRLATGWVSRASAEQRAGRAGRTRPGRCIRLWSRGQHTTLREREVPEIRRLDLTAISLDLHAWGLRDVQRFRWLDAPRPGSVERAERLLHMLGAVEADGTLSAIGRRMARMPVPPRWARMLVEAERRGCAEEAATVAALAGERDILTTRGPLAETRLAVAGSGASDLLERRERFQRAWAAGFRRDVCESLGIDVRRARSVERTRRQLLRHVQRGASARAGEEDDLLRCILAGYPDRVVRRRAASSARGVMVGGTGVVIAEGSVVRTAEFLVATEIVAGARGTHAESRIEMASAIEADWLEEVFPGSVAELEQLVFDEETGRVVALRRSCFHDLVLTEHRQTGVNRQRAGEILAQAVTREPDRHLGDPESIPLLARLRFLHGRDGSVPDPRALVIEALRAACTGCRSVAEMRRQQPLRLLEAQLDSGTRRRLAREAPTHWTLPGGRRVPIHYEEDRPPWIEVRIQQLFGVTETPRLAGVPLVIRLLAPNGRPAQITDDLAGFWKGSYAEVRKQLRGRYPKHHWPEDPTAAQGDRRGRRARLGK